jgi:hypothetical protein
VVVEEIPFGSEKSNGQLLFVVVLEFQYLHCDKQIEQESWINGLVVIAYYFLVNDFVLDCCLQAVEVLAWLFSLYFVSWEVVEVLYLEVKEDRT